MNIESNKVNTASLNNKVTPITNNAKDILVTYDALAALKDTRRSLDAWMDGLSAEDKAALGEALAARFKDTSDKSKGQS